METANIRADYNRHVLKFKFPAGTSRGVMTEKPTWFISVWDESNPGVKGIGECSVIKGLSSDDQPDYEQKLTEVCKDISSFIDNPGGLADYPSVRFGLETALKDLETGGRKVLFPSKFTKGRAGIPINGLIWMGDMHFMLEQIRDKLNKGFTCLKMKIGTNNFEDELHILKKIRLEFNGSDLELRVDANGAFSFAEAPEKLRMLSEFNIHSIEQPIKAGQPSEMGFICASSPIPVALDEELIGKYRKKDKEALLQTVRPHYIILKPSMTGGFQSSTEWIQLAKAEGAGWWITSALESNIGLSAIAQWTFTLKNPMAQGLGTGQLFENNVDSPLEIRGNELYYYNKG